MVRELSEEEMNKLVDDDGNLALLPPGYIIKVSKNMKPYVSRLPGAPVLPEGKIIKISTNLKPFISRVSVGKTQLAFAEKYGRPVGNCVKANVRKGMTGGEIHDIVKKCSQNPEYVNPEYLY